MKMYIVLCVECKTCTNYIPLQYKVYGCKVPKNQMSNLSGLQTIETVIAFHNEDDWNIEGLYFKMVATSFKCLYSAEYIPDNAYLSER